MTAKKNNKVKPQVNGSSEERDEIKMSLLSKGKWWPKLHLTPRGQKKNQFNTNYKDDDSEEEKLLANDENDFEHEIFNINHRKSYI